MAVNVKGGALEFDAFINLNNFEAQINKINSQLESLTGSAQKEATSVDNLIKKTTQAIAVYASLATAKNFVSDIVRTRGEFQQLEVAFRTMLKSKSEADALLANATKLAATTPFTLQDVGAGAKQLLAYGFAANQITDTLRRLGDIAAGVGAPLNDITYIYGTLKVQGRAYAEDIRQFTQRGIPIISELAKQFGVTEQEVSKLVEAGKVGFPEVEKAFNALTSQGGLFFNLMQEQSKTLTGQISNLQDAWSRMLNDIGKSNEGVFSGAIAAATKLVENYQTVLDILKVLVLTYGSYRAAVIATTVAENIATAASKGYTIAETLRYQAMLVSERTMQILNKTMLSNPYVVVIAGILSIVSAYAVLRRETIQITSATELLKEAQTEANNSFTEQEAKVKQYVSILNNQNIAESVRLDAYNKLKDIAPKIIENLTFQEAKTKDLTDRTNEFIAALKQQIRIQSLQGAFQKALEQEDKARGNLKKQSSNVKDNSGEALSDEAGIVAGIDQEDLNKAKKTLEEAIKARIEVEKQIAATAGTGTKDAILAQISGLEAEQKMVDRTSLAYKEYEQQINSLKKTLEALNNTNVAAPQKTFEQLLNEADSLEKLNTLLKVYQDNYSKATTLPERKKLSDEIVAIQKKIKELDLLKQDKAEQELENKINQLLDKRKDILQDISELQRDAKQSGLIKDQSELDKINEKYDKAIIKITDYNKKVDEFNKKNKTSVQKVGITDINALNSARRDELGNQRAKDQFEDYKKFIKDAQDLFTRFEDYKVQFGEKKARELTDFQTGEFSDTIDFLKTQLAVVSQDSSFAGKLKKEFLVNAIADAQKDKLKRDTDKQVEEFKKVADATVTFNIKRKQLEEQYQKDVATLRKNFSGEELTEREQALKESHERDLKDLERNAILSSGIFKKMNEDILFFTREQIKQRIKELRQYLKDNATLPPEVKKAIFDQIKQLNDVLKEDSSSKRVVQDFQKISEVSALVGDNTSKIAESFRGLNDDLADTLQSLSDIANIVSTAASAVANFAAGNIAGGIGATVGVISGVVNFFKAARQSRIEALKEVDAFNDQIAASEQEINLIYREREREQVKLNKLKLQGLADEKKLLEEQKKASAQQFQTILQQLQEQVAVIGKGTEKYGGVFGIGKKTRVVDITESLAGKSYDELEKLFLSGELEGKAKELFEELQKIKQEGVDIDKLLADNAEATREAFTGTTADNITDSIVDGFKNGLRSAQDFANNFQQLMQNAVLQSLKLQALEGPLNDFFQQFADATESDNILTDQEIQTLQQNFNAIIDNAGKKFEELQKITNLGFSSDSSNSSAKSLTGAIKGITEQQADLLAGQFGGLRLTALDHLKVASNQLSTLQAIQNHTSNLEPMYRLWQRLELNGIKMH